MQPLNDEWFVTGYELQISGALYRQSWRGLDDVPVARVRALAFARDGGLLLVRGDVGLQLPGGGIETGESTSEALDRELWEEAAARIESAKRMGAVQIDLLEDGRQEFHDFYCCRVSLEESWTPTDEISERVTVSPDRFLDTLHWGRSDPKAAFLLELALQAESEL